MVLSKQFDVDVRCERGVFDGVFLAKLHPWCHVLIVGDFDSAFELDLSPCDEGNGGEKTRERGPCESGIQRKEERRREKRERGKRKKSFKRQK